MKKLFILFIAAFALITINAYAAEDITGTYEGWYYADQGQTGLTLTVNKDGSGVFEFYNMPGKSNAANGSYTVTVSEENGQYIVTGDEWIDRPSTYIFVSLEGTLKDGVFSGSVNNSSWEFVLMKNTDAYAEVSGKVFGSHRYEVFTDSKTWYDAEAYCESLGGHLVTINSAEEQEFIEQLLSDYPDADYMIGTHRDLNEFSSWVTGEAMTYTNWGTPQPDNTGGSQNTGVICNGRRNGGSSYNIEKGQWDDNGDRYYAFICEWDGWSDAAEWSTPELQEAADKGLIPDVLVGKDMTQPITRGEFAAVSVNLYEAMTGGRAVMSSSAEFKDISDNENRNYILKAYNIGAVRGYSSTEYAPDALLQREELAAMLTRVYKKSEWPDWTIENDDNYTINYSGVQKFADDDQISEYAKPSVYFLVKYGVLSGVGNNMFAPKNSTPAQEAAGYANATREQAVVMSLRSFQNLND